MQILKVFVTLAELHDVNSCYLHILSSLACL